VDGEGSFNVSLIKRNDYSGDWKVTASFNVSQRDRIILALIKHTLGCGRLRTRKDGVVYYEVTSVTMLVEKIIPFFNKFGFLSQSKKRNFSIFKQIVFKMHKKEHLNQKGLREILELREQLNEGRGRKRKYTIKDVINTM
jgi:hypothetical protein